MNDAKQLLFNGLIEEHDTLIKAREAQKTRLSLLLVVAGFIGTVFSFSLGVVLGAFSRADSIAEFVALSFAIALFFATLFVLGLIFHRALVVLGGRIETQTAIPDFAGITLGVFKAPDEGAPEFTRAIASKYVDAIKNNREVNRQIGEHLRYCSLELWSAIVLTGFYLAVTAAAVISVNATDARREAGEDSAHTRSVEGDFGLAKGATRIR